MASILKTVLTPLKWVSKKAIRGTLLRFPGGEAKPNVACVYCPEMCRFACPTAVVSASDAVTPCNKMSLLYKEEKWPGRSAGGGELWPIYDCTGCGRCTEYCVYGMPVASRLFEARAEHGWGAAREAAAAVTDEEDPAGDLAEELGDAAGARRRLAAARAAGARGDGGPAPRWREPKAVAHLRAAGVAAELAWWPLPAAGAGLARLAGRRWLVHESPWLSRHLGRAPEVRAWIEATRALGTDWVLPFESGRDCADCGGEGAYARMFGAQAARMAQDLWARDRHRADGIACFSDRCAAHLRAALGPGVAVVVIPREIPGSSNGEGA